MYPTASQALVFTFSFANTTGTTNGTVTGDIDGLVNGTGVAATNVILDSYPTGLVSVRGLCESFESVTGCLSDGLSGSKRV